MQKTFRNKITVLIFRMLRYSRLLLFEIQSYYNKNERNQPYIKPDYRKYFPDAVAQKLDVLRNSAHLGEKLYVKPDCRKYYPDAVIQRLYIIRNSAKEGEKRSETRLPYLFPGCCDTVDCYYSKFSHTTIRMRETNVT